MKPAKNIVELYNNLEPRTVLYQGENDDQYVPFYKLTIQQIRAELIAGKRTDATFYIAGQSGTGKTTAMNFLPNETINKKFDVVYLYGRDLFDPNDVDIIDILLMFSFKLIENKPKLEKTFYKKLEKIYEKHIGVLEEQVEKQKNVKVEAGLEGELSAGIKLLFWLKAKATFFANFKMDSLYRKVTRTFFQFKKLDLLTLANEIVDEYYQSLDSGKQLLVIFDDLDKMRVLSQIRSVFIDNRNYINQINCKKIISIPIHLPAQAEFRNNDANTYFFELKLKTNPFGKYNSKELQEQKQAFEKNKKLMKKIVSQRMEKDSALITKVAIEYAIEMSGGLLRQYVNILHKAISKVMALNIDGAKISENDIENAIQRERNLMGRAVIGNEKIDLLVSVMQKKTPKVDNDLFIESILSNQIIVYQNGDPWYDINPVIEHTLKLYSAQK